MVQVLASTTTAKMAAAALTAATLIGGAFNANAQQMAAVQPNYSRCDQMAQAGNHVAASQCRVDTLQAHTHQLRADTSQIRAEGDCAAQLNSMRTTNPAIVERGRTILAGRTLRDFGACNLVRALTQG